MIYDVDYFISKFSAIPDSKWGVRKYKNNGKRCALGHCGVTLGKSTEEGEVLSRLFFDKFEVPITRINDATNSHKSFKFYRTDALFLGNTPKKRILAALELIKAGVSI